MSLDRTYGLDLYDFEARQYDAIAPWFTSIDPLAEKYYSISPYAYCAGDPVNLVDPTGCAPDSLEAALMADHVYNGEGELSGGWTCTQRGNDSNGLQWGVYARIVEGKTTEFVMAFAGTDFNDARDIGEDLLQGAGCYERYEDLRRSQYGTASTHLQSLVRDNWLQGLEITAVGHSLGGGIATFASLDNDIPAVTFNPAAVHDNTLKAAGIDVSSRQINITNYIVEGEILNRINSITPNARTYGRDVYISGSGNPAERHKMGVVINSLRGN